MSKSTIKMLIDGGAMSDIKEAYESGKAVGRCQGARDMEVAIALDNKEASLRIAQQADNIAMVPCRFHYRCRSCTLNFKLSCPEKPCVLALHQ